MALPMQKIITAVATVLAVLVGGAHMRAVEETGLQTELRKAIRDLGSKTNLARRSSYGRRAPATKTGVDVNQIAGEYRNENGVPDSVTSSEKTKEFADALDNLEKTGERVKMAGTITTNPDKKGGQEVNFYNQHGPPLREIEDIQPLIQAAYYKGVSDGSQEMLFQSGQLGSLGEDTKVKALFTTNWASSIGHYMDGMGPKDDMEPTEAMEDMGPGEFTGPPADGGFRANGGYGAFSFGFGSRK